MTPLELEKYLHDHIPLSKAMQVSVLQLSRDSVVLSAPLAPNINHRETVFGGSSSALGILAAWSLLHTRIIAEGISSRLVIQRNSVSYDAPITGEFSARSMIPPTSDWSQFLRILNRKGKGRIAVQSDIYFDGRIVGHLEGEFVAIDGSQGLIERDVD